MKIQLTLAIIAIASFANADFVYNEFTSPADLQLNGTAATFGSVLRMTEADVSGQTATAWHTNLQDLSNGFAVVAVFNGNGTSDLGNWGPNSGADGLAFAFQSDSTTAIGNGGGDNGIGGIANMVAISYRTFWNDIKLITTDSNGDIVDELTWNYNFDDNVNYALAATWNPNSTTWNIFAGLTQNGLSLVGSANLDTSSYFANPVYAGLGSGTGGADNNNDVLAWSVTAEAVPEPATMTVLGLAAIAAYRKKRKA
jgi:hypothetical protein